MIPRSTPEDRRPVVLHLLPEDLERGAQRYAAALRDALQDQPFLHWILTFYRSDVIAARPDLSLGLSRSMPAVARAFDLRVAHRLGRVLREINPSVVVAHGSEPLKYLALSRWSGPSVYYKVGVSHIADPRSPRVLLHRTLLRVPDRVVGVSSACRDEAEQRFGVPSDRLRVIPNGRDPSVFFPASTPVDSSGARLLFVGHLSPTKRPIVFIDLVERLRASGIQVSATMVGGGPLEREVRSRASSASVAMLGARDDVPSLLRDSDILVFTSVPSGEGMPGVLIEAGMSGLPVVTTDVPGARDVVINGETGFVVAPGDPFAMDEHVAALARDAQLRKEFGRAARERCERHFSISASAAQWAALVEEIAGRGAEHA